MVSRQLLAALAELAIPAQVCKRAIESGRRDSPADDGRIEWMRGGARRGSERVRTGAGVVAREAAESSHLRRGEVPMQRKDTCPPGKAKID